MIPVINSFIGGALTFGFIAASLFFLRFWRRTEEKLFAIFAVSFLLLGIERIILVFTSADAEFRPYIYITRLVAFLLIIAGILEKNRRPS